MGRTKHPINKSSKVRHNVDVGRNSEGDASTVQNLENDKELQGGLIIEGMNQSGATEHNEHRMNSEREEDNGDCVLGSIQVVTSQTCTSETSRHNRPIKRKRDVCCRKLIDLQPGQKLHVDFDEDKRPIGPNASIFTVYLGQIVRNRTCCPLQVSEWKFIESSKIEFAWNVVLAKFTMDQPEMRKEFVLKHMNSLYRGHRYKLKAEYYDDPELISRYDRENNKPKKVLKQDWLYLCELWRKPEFKAKSRKNRENRSLQKLPHYSGTKSYARIAEELREKNSKGPTRVDILIESRKRNSKKAVNKEKLANNVEAISKMKDYVDERGEGKNQMNDDEIFNKVLGEEKHGYLRAYGRNKSITDHFGTKPSRLNLTEIEKMVDERFYERTRRMDEKLAERDKLWEEKFKRLCDSLGVPQINQANQDSSA